MLIIFLLLIVFFIVWSYIKAKARKQFANKTQSMRQLATMEALGTLEEEAPYPSWVSNPSPSKQKEFVGMLLADTRRKKIPDSFFGELWNSTGDRQKFLYLAGMMEENNSSFEGQAMAVADWIDMTWSKTSHAEKQVFNNDKYEFLLHK